MNEPIKDLSPNTAGDHSPRWLMAVTLWLVSIVLGVTAFACWHHGHELASALFSGLGVLVLRIGFSQVVSTNERGAR